MTDPELDGLVTLVQQIQSMIDQELRLRGARPVVVRCAPASGWPTWCRGFLTTAPAKAVQGFLNVLDVFATMMLARQMGVAEGGPTVDLNRAAMIAACAAERGFEPDRDPVVIRRILATQREVGGDGGGSWPSWCKCMPPRD